MVFSKELQEKILACEEDGFSIDGSVNLKDIQDVQYIEKRLVCLTDVCEGIKLIEIDGPATGQLFPIAFLHKESKTLFPLRTDAKLEEGPLHVGRDLGTIQYDLINTLYDQILRIAFQKDGTPCEDEIPKSLRDTLPLDKMKPLIMLAAAVIYRYGDLSFKEFLDKISTENDLWVPQISAVLRRIELSKAEIITSEVSPERAAILGRIRKRMWTENNSLLLRSLYCLSQAKLIAEADLKTAENQEKAAAVRKFLDEKEIKYDIRVLTNRLGGGKTEEVYCGNTFSSRFSPLGIVGTCYSKSRFIYTSEIYDWDDIVWIKHGNAFLYKQ